MKRFGLMVAFGLGTLSMIGLAQSQKTLTLFNWSEYMDPQILRDFEKACACRVNTPVYESNEDLLAKLKQGGVSYDVIVPSDYIVPVLIRSNLLQKLDRTKLSNYRNLSPKFVNTAFDPKSEYTAGYQWGTTGIIYNKKLLPKHEQSWALLFDPKKQKGNFVLMNDMRVTIGAALKYAGKSLNSRSVADLKAAEKLLEDAKRRSRGFVEGVNASKTVLSGTAAAAISFNGEANRFASENKNIGFFIPKEGSTLALDMMAIPASSQNVALAHQFINFILDPKVGARLSNYTAYASPNDKSKVFINKALTENPGVYPPQSVLAKLEQVQDLGNDMRLYDTVWTRVKSK
jgi:spermidine/putrescine transport system substrate-binding protein